MIKETLAMFIMAGIIIWAFGKAQDVPVVVKDIEGKVCFCVSEQTKYEPGSCEGIDLANDKYEAITWRSCQEEE